MRTRRRGDRAAWVAFGAGQLAILAYPFLADLAVLGSVWYLAVAALGVAMSGVAAVRHRGTRRRVWVALGLGMLLFFLGDVLWIWFDLVLHIEPFPSVADVSYVAGYPMLAIGLAWLVRGRQPGGDRSALLDSAIITTGLGVLVGVEVLLPALTDSSASVMSRLVSSAYPLGDLLLLGMVARLAVTPGRRLPAFWALSAAMSAVLATDAAYNVLVILDSPAQGSAYLDMGWLQQYVLMGAAALHSSAPLLSDAAPRHEEGLSRVRLALLGAAAVLAPGTLILQAIRSQSLYPFFVGVGSIVIFMLVLMRVAGLLRKVEAQSLQLAAMARSDALTGLPNRGSWDHELARMTEAAREHGHELTIALLDLDYFKRYNDTRGHLAGDRLLQELSSVWRACLSGRGVLARYGGEEFALAVPGVPVAEVEGMVRTLCSRVPDGQHASAGIATWDPADTVSELMIRVDSALYAAKRGGRNTVVVAGGSVGRPRRDSRPRQMLVPRPVFQPIVALATGKIVAVEALSRFDGSSVPPDEVFARAWLRGHGPELEAAAIRAVLQERGALRDLPVHINVSARGLVTQPVLEAFPADLRSVVLEITEQDISADMEVTVEVISELRQRGATLAIDDFGVGFSNLRRMIGLRPEVIKLDRSLISGVENDQGSRSVIAAMASQALLNEQKICAEGIETPAELETLLDLGVPHGQGYLFSAPVSVAELGLGLARAIRERSRACAAERSDVAAPLGSRRA